MKKFLILCTAVSFFIISGCTFKQESGILKTNEQKRGFDDSNREKLNIKDRDAERIANIKQIQAALELYLNEEGHYPQGNNLILGIGNAACLGSKGFGSAGCKSSYMSGVPFNPTPGGSDYKYTFIDDNSYELYFSLETKLGGLNAGIHCATEAGVGEGSSCSRPTKVPW